MRGGGGLQAHLASSGPARASLPLRRCEATLLFQVTCFRGQSCDASQGRWGGPGPVGWFGSSREPSVCTHSLLQSSDFLLFYWLGGQMGFNKSP